MLAQPVAHLVVVERVEAARIGRQAGTDRAAQAGQHQVEHLPQPAAAVVGGDHPAQQVAGGGGDGVDQPQHQLGGKQRQPLDDRAQQTGGLDHRRGGRQLAVAQQPQHELGERLRIEHAGALLLGPGAGLRRRWLSERAQQRHDQLGGADHVALHGVGVAALQRVAGRAAAGREEGQPVLPFAVRPLVRQRHMAVGEEGVAPVGDRAVGGVAPELLVALAHQPEGVLVVAQPEMQPVLLDAVGRAAAGGPLAAQPPALLVDRDPVAAPVLGPGELEGGGDPRAAAADDGDLDRPAAAHRGLPPSGRAGSSCACRYP